MVSNAELMTLNAYREARNQPDDGVAAIPRIVGNRARLHYECDGQEDDAIERHAQFSWTEYDDTGGYHRVAFNTAEELARIEQLLVLAKADAPSWSRCTRIVGLVAAGKYQGGLAYQRLTSDTVLYYNPDACAAPPWARPSAFVCRIGAHEFFRDLAFSSGLRRAPPVAPAKLGSAAALPPVVTANL